MAAAASLIEVTESIEMSIREVFSQICGSSSPSESYRLTFTFNGSRPISSIFDFTPDGIENPCIQLDTCDRASSEISSNTPAKACFTPSLQTPDLFPPLDGKPVTQTDILQVLSTKLKFTSIASDSFEILDIAKLIHKDTCKRYCAPFSLWRLLRGEDTLYEKYGYTNAELYNYKLIVSLTKWEEIKDIVIPERGKTLQAFVESSPIRDFFHDGKTIVECMRHLSYEQANEVLSKGKLSNIDYSIVHLIVLALKEKGHISPPLQLTIHRDSEIWKKWDSILQFVAFERIMRGGRRYKKTTKRRRMRCRTHRRY